MPASQRDTDIAEAPTRLPNSDCEICKQRRNAIIRAAKNFGVVDFSVRLLRDFHLGAQALVRCSRSAKEDVWTLLYERRGANVARQTPLRLKPNASRLLNLQQRCANAAHRGAQNPELPVEPRH